MNVSVTDKVTLTYSFGKMGFADWGYIRLTVNSSAEGTSFILGGKKIILTTTGRYLNDS